MEDLATPMDRVNICGRKTLSNIKRCFLRTFAFFHVWESGPAGPNSSAKNAQKKGEGK